MPVASIPGEYVVDANTVGLWHFNEPSGDIWYDVSGNGNHGQVTGTSIGSGVFGGGRSRTSSGEGIWIQHDPNLNPGENDFTIEVWFKMPGGLDGSDNLINKYDGSAGYFMYVAGGGNFEITDGSGLAGHNAVIRSSTNVVDNEWHHMAGVREAGTIKLFIDGKLAGSADASLVGSLDNEMDVKLDAWPSTLDEVRFSSVARTAEELLRHYERAMPPVAPLNLAANPGAAEVTLNWSPNPEGDLSHYLIYQGLTSAFDTTGAQVARIDQPDTTSTIKDLENGTTYYFSITAVDHWGMTSDLSAEASAEPVAYPLLVAATDPERPIGWHDPEVTFTFDLPLDPATITSSAVVVGDISNRRVSFDLVYDDQANKISVDWSACLVSCDTISITLVADHLLGEAGQPIDGDADGVPDGSPEDDIVRTYTVAPYADFDTSGTIDFDDLALFTAGWYGEDFACELGPATGTAPHLIVTPDDDFNLRDLMTFIRMWDWYSPQAAPLAKALAPSNRLELNVSTNGQQLLVGLDAAVKPAAVHLQLTYAPDKVQAAPDSSGSSYSLQIQRTWPGEGILEIDAALPSDVAGELIIPVSLDIQGRDAVSVGIYLEAVDRNGVRLGTAEQMVEVKPVPLEFALHQNYPNPFNPATTVDYDLPTAGNTSLTVYDLLGREVIRLVDGYAEAGYYQAVWRGRSTRGGAAGYAGLFPDDQDAAAEVDSPIP
jgi:hypothetical protein